MKTRVSFWYFVSYCSYFEEVDSLKKSLLWARSLSENVTALKESIHYENRHRNFLKKIGYDYVTLSSKILNIVASQRKNKQISKLGSCFAESTLNSIGPFQGRPQGVQFKGFNSGLLLIRVLSDMVLFRVLIVKVLLRVLGDRILFRLLSDRILFKFLSNYKVLLRVLVPWVLSRELRPLFLVCLLNH